MKTTSMMLLLTAASVPSLKAATPEKPNVIVFLVDDMGLMDTSVPFITDRDGRAVRYGLNALYQTPNMESLAETGIRFSRFYAQSVSSPSRVSIMTGENSTRHGVTNWIHAEGNNRDKYGPMGWNWEGLKCGDATLPLMLQKEGYKTIHVGKAHFGAAGFEGADPHNLGFEVNVGGFAGGEPGSYFGEEGYGKSGGLAIRAVPDLEKYHGTDTFLTEALTIEANREIETAVEEDRPFFLHMAHYAVHAMLGKFVMDNRFAEHYVNTGYPMAVNEFASMIEGVDKSLGDIVDKLNDLGIAEDTLIIFLGDNGSDSRVGDGRGYSSSAPLKGMKGTEFEGGVRVPFIVSWAKPSKESKVQKSLPVKSGAIQTQLATVMDIYPTVLSLAGVEEYPNTVDGFNIKREIAGKFDKSRPNRVLCHFPHGHRGSYFTSFTDGDWKLIYYYSPANPDNASCLLYNLKEDPFETTDLSSDRTKCNEMIENMIAQLESENANYPETEDGVVLKPHAL